LIATIGPIKVIANGKINVSNDTIKRKKGVTKAKAATIRQGDPNHHPTTNQPC
jgi:hypothetical protein